MQFSDIFWIFVLFSLLSPIVRQRMLESSRLRALHRFESRRGSRVITLIHRQESMSLFPQSANRRPSVQYIPTPYHRDTTRRGR